MHPYEPPKWALLVIEDSRTDANARPDWSAMPTDADTGTSPTDERRHAREAEASRRYAERVARDPEVWRKARSTESGKALSRDEARRRYLSD